MEIGILDIKGSLPCFENFGNLPTKIIDENNIKDIKDLDMLIIPGGSIVESKSINENLKKEIMDFDEYIIGICSGFQILSEKVDIGRKSPVPIIRDGLGLLNVEFSPLICTDRVKATLKIDSILGKKGTIGEGFHCHTYGDIKITDKKTKPFTTSEVKKLNYKMQKTCKNIISGAICGKVIGTMVHGFLDNEHIRNNILDNLKVDEEERKKIFEKNKEVMKKLKLKGLKFRNNTNKNITNTKNEKEIRGIILLATGSESGKTFLTTAISSKLDGKVLVSKIGPDVRDIVPALYLLREPMLKYSSIKIGDRGWCEVSEYLNYLKNSNYDYIIIEGVMGAFTGALNKKNYSGSEIAKLLNFPVYVVSACNKSGIEGAFVESLAYYSLLKEMGVKVEGIILNKVYNFDVFEKVKKIGDEIGIKVIGIRKAEMEKRGLIPEVEIDYEEFCKLAMELDIKLEIPKVEIKDKNEKNKNFEDYLEEWSKKIKNIT
ncbi:AAA family ATPase [Methanotorris formicicus]|uniref:CobB/CobQ domain protein glutamine amidotransferase n=1 Tax=Methanotorris formicicus Mc-S-70 TaxID=647171 RepID=H1KYD1_9EURY|nr:AAA family ATPase [Methanotorris formicicus]EHP87215.1 CobB/CobQ domain protein glutamine amidotransferase [Methanotorris formicicus Mc-S-70]